MIYKTNIFLALLVFAFVLNSNALFGQEADYGLQEPEFERVAQAGWQFLKIPTNARMAAMGGTITATGHGNAANALTNPASTADVQGIDLSFTTMNWIADIGFNAASVVKSFGNLGNFGINVVFIDYGDMIRTENQEILTADGNRTGLAQMALDLGTVTAGDMAVGLSYARSLTDKLEFGTNVRYVREELDDAVTSNWAVDFGTVYHTGIRSLRLGMVGRNFGPDAEFADWNERVGVAAMSVKMPMSYSFGAAMDLIEGGENEPHMLTGVAEFIHPNDGPEKINLGAEYTFNTLFSLRGGYRFNYDEEGITFGGGLNVETSNFAVEFNYSYWAFGNLGSVNMISIGLGL